MSFLDKELVNLHGSAKKADEAITQAGELLVNAGYVSEQYVEKMVESYHENGAYFVIAPKIAIPHARPTDGVENSAVSLVVLKEGVNFGHAANDPVRLVFGLAATSSEAHLKVIQKIVSLLSNNDNIEKMIQAKDYQAIGELMEG
ncbi:PTS sugar transporter subunit IIA [Listeria seeligeri]|uniref:PTS sugar transporter subunit IIA n=1 Tax=Listeria seeligeri TaxID=1640 RepID=UPI001623274F|nr:PTS sugar transporter subunit IIA [Listeria seeligeri]MBC1916978.1 PTS sugar transporter subunit IIA [Listeria seeligeri]MBF2421241.1 PTS sugar transporter subunit IIA [Listeria seeligeri]MBF2439797.1 PTS sugar transporter subunit IIA [Listeria seeligeri]MBF2501531.1 PTS sugar transporter subunit IIA [Listeria seeligeri]